MPSALVGIISFALKIASSLPDSLALNAAGFSLVQSLISSGGKLTICLMSYYHDYLDNH